MHLDTHPALRLCSDCTMSFFAGKTCLITGATSGYGLKLANSLMGQSAKLILTHRGKPNFPDTLKEATKVGIPLNAYLQELHLDDLDSVRGCAKTIGRQRIDFIFNSAGIMSLSFRETKQNFEQNLAVNHLGPFLLTNLLLDNIPHGGQIVNLTCGALKTAKNGLNFEQLKRANKSEWESLAYAESKLCNVLTTIEMQKRLNNAGRPIYVNCVQMGAAATNIFRDLPSHQRWLMNFFLADPENGADALLKLVSEVKNGGQFFSLTKDKLPEFATNPDAARKLWIMSANLTHLDSPL